MLVDTPTLARVPKLEEDQRYVSDQQGDGRIQPCQLDTSVCEVTNKEAGKPTNMRTAYKERLGICLTATTNSIIRPTTLLCPSWQHISEIVAHLIGFLTNPDLHDSIFDRTSTTPEYPTNTTPGFSPLSGL